MNSSIQKILAQNVMDIEKLKDLCSRGCLFEDGVRSLCWKLFLNYLPAEKFEWESLLKKQRQSYREYVVETIYNHKSSESIDDTVIDHPLNPDPQSVWNSYFRDNEVLLQIHKDVQRIHPKVSFFHEKTDFPCKICLNGKKTFGVLRERIQNKALPAEAFKCFVHGLFENEPTDREAMRQWQEKNHREFEEYHWEVIERIMFVFYKLNPGQGYVQGMNEIIGPIYYVFATDPNDNWREHAEADTFFCFINLMALIRNNFLRSADLSPAGIDSQIKRFGELLKKEDSNLYYLLTYHSVHLEYFAFRWLTLLLSQEFCLRDVLVIWDVLFSRNHPLDLLPYICVAMVCAQREKIISGNFSVIVKLLQNYPDDIEIEDIIASAYYIMNKNREFVKL